MLDASMLPVEISRKGRYCMWEYGGAYTSQGNARVISDCNGNPKVAMYIREHGDLCNSDHALVPVNVGDYSICAYHDHWWEDDIIEINEIVKFSVNEDGEVVAIAKRIDCIPACLFDAMKAAVDKNRDYHCRSPYFVKLCFSDEECNKVSSES